MRTLELALGSALAAWAASCASFRTPDAFDQQALRRRAVTQEKDGVRVAATLLSRDEIRPIFGVDLMQAEIQPVWLEIENRTERVLFFLPTGLDPEYYAPLEVGHRFHSTFGGDASRELDEHLSALGFDSRAPIPPGRTVSGFVYTNAEEHTKVLDVDLFGESWSSSLTLFAPVPDHPGAARRIEAIEARFSEPERVELADADALRRAVEGLPCCAQDESGAHRAPLNLVVVGELDEWIPAFQRRGFRYEDAPPLLAFQRAQDLDGSRRARWVDAQPHLVRFWQTPLRVEAGPVWLAQVGTPRGGRFATDPGSLEPRPDDARNDVVEDLFYSQSLAKIGFVRGGGCAAWAAGDPGQRSTDGLRVLLVFDERAIALDEIGFFDWERIVAPTSTIGAVRRPTEGTD